MIYATIYAMIYALCPHVTIVTIITVKNGHPPLKSSAPDSNRNI